MVRLFHLFLIFSRLFDHIFVLGVSIYSGPCWFVLTITDGERYPTCWSVADGHDASTMDNWNPIRSIYMLISEDNVSVDENN